MSNPFFKNLGPFSITEILETLNSKKTNLIKDKQVSDIRDLYSSNVNDITFFHSNKYINIAKNTKASFCITSET